MSARRKKDQPPMKYRGFYCPDDLWNEMQKHAEALDEPDSEYIRIAIRMRNETRESDKPSFDSTHKNNTTSKPLTCSCGNEMFYIGSNGKIARCSKCGEVWNEHGEKIGVRKPLAEYGFVKQVQSFPKGGGKK